MESGTLVYNIEFKEFHFFVQFLSAAIQQTQVGSVLPIRACFG